MASASNPRRMSVAPQATQICVPAGIGIIGKPPAYPQAAPHSPAQRLRTGAGLAHCAAPPRSSPCREPPSPSPAGRTATLESLETCYDKDQGEVLRPILSWHRVGKHNPWPVRDG
jgi:hypothetical protein